MRYVAVTPIKCRKKKEKKSVRDWGIKEIEKNKLSETHQEQRSEEESGVKGIAGG